SGGRRPHTVRTRHRDNGRSRRRRRRRAPGQELRRAGTTDVRRQRRGPCAACRPHRLPLEDAMVTIQLEPDQAVMLREMLEGYLGDLRMEVAQTDLMDVREDLKK